MFGRTVNCYPPKTLVVSSFSSRCGDCGKSCDPASDTHDVILGYGRENGSPGCGVRWENVTCDYTDERFARATREQRPDLRFIGPLDRDTGGRDERAARASLYPSRGRDVMAAPKEAPAELVTPGRMTHPRGDADEHAAE